MIVKFFGVLLLVLGFQSAYAFDGEFTCAKGQKFQETLELGAIAVKLSATCVGDWGGEWYVDCYDEGDASGIAVIMVAEGIAESGVIGSGCFAEDYFENDAKGLSEADFKRMRTECDGGKGADKTKIILEAKAFKGDGEENLCFISPS